MGTHGSVKVCDATMPHSRNAAGFIKKIIAYFYFYTHFYSYSYFYFYVANFYFRASEMSDTYHSASTMAWPGEEETDFNFRPPAWEILGERILQNNFIFPIYLFIYLFIYLLCISY